MIVGSLHTPREPDAEDASRRFADVGAVDWWARRGWQVTTSSDRLIMFIDEEVRPLLTVRRLWTTPVTVARRSGAPLTDDLVLFIQIAEKSEMLFDDGGTVLLDAGAIVFCTSRRIVRVSSAPPFSAHIEVVVSGLRLPGVLAGSGRLAIPDATSSPFRNALVALVNVILNAPRPPTGATPFRDDAFVSLVSGLLVESRGVGGIRLEPTRGRDLYADALEAIRRRAADPATNVATIAENLGVSPRHLTRALRAHGTTPSRAIAEHRAFLARTAAAAAPEATLQDIATAAGYSSARALRAAVLRDATRTASPVGVPERPRP